MACLVPRMFVSGCLVLYLSPRTLYTGIRLRPRKWRLGCSSLCPRSPCARHRVLAWGAHRSVHSPGYSVHLLIQPEHTICYVYMPNPFHWMHMYCNVGNIYHLCVHLFYCIQFDCSLFCWHAIFSVALIFCSDYFYFPVIHLLCVSIFLTTCSPCQIYRRHHYDNSIFVYL